MKRLLLIGGGHAHLFVLEALAMRPWTDVEVTLITPFRQQLYSGMVPGWIAGFYTLEDCQLPITQLAQKAGVTFVQSTVCTLDLSAKHVVCANGEVISFDILSIDCGSESHPVEVKPPAADVIPIRPIEAFAAAWPDLLEKIRRVEGDFDLVMVGAGAAGVELALAIQARLANEGLAPTRLTLIGSKALPLSGFPPRLSGYLIELLAQRGIRYLPQQRALSVERSAVHLADGSTLAASSVLLVTGAAAPAWLEGAGLAVDAHGFVAVGGTLQSRSHPFAFAAGDAASLPNPRPKSGVFAVRAGPLLAANLKANCQDAPLDTWRPQRHALYLISTGRKHALAVWAGLGSGGAWVWRWKDRIDRRFIERFRSAAADAR